MPASPARDGPSRRPPDGSAALRAGLDRSSSRTAIPITSAAPSAWPPHGTCRSWPRQARCRSSTGRPSIPSRWSPGWPGCCRGGPWSRSSAAATSATGVRPFDPQAGVPGLPEWICVPTPGHTPGHVAFFRPGDGTLIAGDAVLTMAWSSRLGGGGAGWLWDLVRGDPRLSGPPTVVTCDWPAAAASVVTLAGPRSVGSGDGPRHAVRRAVRGSGAARVRGAVRPGGRRGRVAVGNAEVVARWRTRRSCDIASARGPPSPRAALDRGGRG